MTSILKSLLPSILSRCLRKYVPLLERDLQARKSNNPFADKDPVYELPDSPFRLGILIEPFQYHKHYIAACRELGVSYRLIDLSGNDWVNRVQQSNCDAFLAWPSVHRRALREMFDERLRIMEHDLGLTVCPAHRETWLYENKCRQRDWMLAKGIAHSPTWIFYTLKDAISFAETAELPVVVKTRLGAANSGVWIVKSRSQLRGLVRKAFSSGILAKNRYRSEVETGFIYIQKFLPVAYEWRLVRIGDDFHGHRKGKSGEFHSGSGKVDWTPPEMRHLDLLKKVTDLGYFTSMDVDVFELENGDLLVNELQTVFGASTSVDQTRVNGKAGKFTYKEGTEEWVFEEGDFARNACANARVQSLLSLLKSKI